MKQSIILSIAILVLGAIPGLIRLNRLADLESTNRSLTAEALELGIPLGSIRREKGSRLTKRQREDLEKQAIVTASEVVAFAKDMAALEASGEDADAAHRRRGMEILMKLQDLDPSQMKTFIDELRSNPELTDKNRSNIVALSIMMLSEEHPQAAVALFTESSDLVKGSLMGDHVITSSLTRWAEDDPHAALHWIETNSEKFPGIVGDEAKQGLLAGAAVNDPKLAFQLIDEVGLEHPASAVYAILSAGSGDPQHRDLLLGALREHLRGMPDAAERDDMQSAAFETFAMDSEGEDFDSLTKWVSDSQFSDKEKEQFAAGLGYYTTKSDTGKWIEWLSDNVTGDSMEDPVQDLISEWTQQDYLAAGTWLSGSAEGPAKMAAVEAYAEAVAEYDPQVAGQWAMTLPVGPKRKQALNSVYQNWPESDPQGAAVFAGEHGLE